MGENISQVSTRRSIVKWLANKRKIIVLGLILIIVVIGGPLYYRRHQSEVIHGCFSRATSTVYTDVAPLLSPGKVDQLKEQLDKISELKHYDRDANCLLPFVAYDIYTGNVTDAQENFKKLKSVYNSKVGIAKPYKGFVSDLDMLQEIVDGLGQFQKESQIKAIFSN